MQHYLIHIAILFFLSCTGLFGQVEKYSVCEAGFSTPDYNEFSPVFYKGGVLFCSDRPFNTVVTIKNPDHTPMINLFYSEKKDSFKWKESRIYDRSLTSALNDGPASLNKQEDVIYFSSNNPGIFTRKGGGSDGQMGIYSAKSVNNKWNEVIPFEHNDPNNSFFSPSLSSDGRKLFFASDMPGGFGGMDIYYCEMKDSTWSKPVNLGSNINTPANEVFPYIHSSGKLFFSSEGHDGLGGKDIFYVELDSGNYSIPVALETPINSSCDDFGIVADREFETGYFSSNRYNSDDVFEFRSNYPDFKHCQKQKTNNFCYRFFDEKYETIDSLPLRYEWHFDGDDIIEGREVQYCFTSPGEHEVELSIFDQISGDTIVKGENYSFSLETIKQAYINAPDTVYVNNPTEIDPFQTNLPGFSIEGYYWDFGDGSNSIQEKVQYSYTKPGTYTIKLGLKGEINTMGIRKKECVSRKIVVVESMGGDNIRIEK